MQWYELVGKPKPEGERFIKTVDEDGWQFDEYGYTDVDGTPVITRRTPRPGGDMNIDQRISRLLSQVEDIGNPNDENLQRAQAFFDFKNQPTKADRLQTALQIAQSPSDYMTLVGLYTGALKMEDPIGYGERIAPLAPFLQGVARQFFMDVPGITEPVKTEQELEQDVQMALPEDRTRLGEPEKTEAEAGEGAGAGGGGFREEYIPAEDFGIWEDDSGEFWGGEYKLPSLTNGNGTTTKAQDDRVVDTTNTGSDILAEKIPSLSSTDSYGAFSFGGTDETPINIPDDVIPKDIPPVNSSSRLTGVRYVPGFPKPKGQFITKPRGKGVQRIDIYDPAMESIYKKRDELFFNPENLEPREALPTDFYGGDFDQGGVVPGFPGDKKLITAEAGEVILPNDPTVRNQMLQKTGMFGPVWRPPPGEEITALTQPMLGSMPRKGMSQIGFRFRSPQTMRGMTPTQMALYRAEVEKHGAPYSDYAAMEQRAAGLSGRNMPSLRFRSPGRMRG